MDPYEQQRIAFDRQRQQDLLEQRYGQQPIVSTESSLAVSAVGKQNNDPFQQPIVSTESIFIVKALLKKPVVNARSKCQDCSCCTRFDETDQI